MVPNELTIGDYVKFQGEIYIVEEISAQGWIHLIYPISGLRLNIVSDYVMHLLEPVPITPKMLELNDFHKHAIGLYSYEVKYKLSIGVLFLPNANENESKIVVNISCLSSDKDGRNSLHSCDINYVHELQHSLKLCKLNDLANNLKVEK